MNFQTGSEVWENIVVPIPPWTEQKWIVVAIQQELGEIETIVRRVQREIDLIREYRTRLIADVVTGKLDIRHLAPDALEPSSADLEPLDGLNEIAEDEMPDIEEPESSEELIGASD